MRPSPGFLDLLAMVITYFSRASLFSWQYQRIHFFLALSKLMILKSRCGSEITPVHSGEVRNLRISA
ncbi:Speedy protein E4 [Fukomys damarensis]|uniref:Speedy protein E4 n=1 Tax=Fukomys damarensis TaxID=885580 RepID=A0A091CQS9_FUKDA|nr:Speedy protein E4 [Fukomys damarensis]